MRVSVNKPDVIKRIRGEGFADYTVIHRLPKIILDIKDRLDSPTKLEAADTLLQSIIEEQPIDTKNFARPTAYWSQYLDALVGATWRELSFFDLEFLFYHGLNSIAGYFDSGVDVFALTRQDALTEAIPSLELGLDNISRFSGIDLLNVATRYSIFSNQVDYSQLSLSTNISADGDSRMLFEEYDRLTQCLQQLVSDQAQVHIIADNAGPELCWDLLMIDVMLQLFDHLTVVIHVKPWPMFVSDALVSDVHQSVDRFLAVEHSAKLRALGTRLSHALTSNQLVAKSHENWGEPRHFNSLSPCLAGELADASLVISKGDLNYRRFIEDRSWPAQTPVATATQDVPFEAFCMRILKSEAVIGLPDDSVACAERLDRSWRTSGQFAVAHFL